MMKMAKAAVATALMLVAGVVNAGESAPMVIDLRTERESGGDETLTYSSLWDGGEGATVTIAQDGTALAANLTDEGERAWSVPYNGTYELTHTTYTDGVAGKVETAKFVVTGKMDPPKITDVSARQRWPWNGLVDITCTVSGIEGTDYGLEFAVEAVMADSSVHNATNFWIVQDGKKSPVQGVCTNGNYRLLWDAGTDLGTGIYSNVVVRVAVVKGHAKVQLWEGGPYWAMTNVGAESPEDSGYYFWWGDTVGCRREGESWVATDGSVSVFSFEEENTPIYNKSIDALLSEGWITADGVLAAEHDAAHVHWGGGWRMPTKQELDDLVSKCNWKETEQNNVKGRTVTGTGAYDTASIFLPAAGYGIGTLLSEAGGFGGYWSSVPFSGYNNYTWYLYFNVYSNGTECEYRDYGQSVRPVQGFSSTATSLPVGIAGESAPILLDILEGPRNSLGDETLTYSSLWDGGENATVTIAQDGEAIAANLTGEGEQAWSVPYNGTYVLTHTTYTNGVAGKVETATFAVTGKVDPPSISYVDRAWDGGAVVASNATCAAYKPVTSGMSTA